MFRKIALTSIALASIAGPAFAMGRPPGDTAAGQYLATSLVVLGACALLCGLAALFGRRVVATLCGLGALAVLVLVAGPALADPAAGAGGTAAVIPWGDWVAAIAKPLFDVIATALAALIVGLIAKFAPWLSTWITRVQIEGTLGRIEAFGLNAVQGAAKGKTLNVELGNEALARMVQYAADSANPLILKAAGGLPGIAEKLFRRLQLDEHGSEATVLAPVQARIASGEIR